MRCLENQDVLRESGCLQLPSQRTLRDYTYHIKAATGYSDEVDDMLMKTAKIDELEDYQKCVLVLMDEMHVKDGLVYDKHSGHVIGFADLGDLNNHMMEFKRVLSGEDQSASLATSMLFIMVKGILSSLEFAYAQFPCSKLTGSLLFDPFWEGVYRLERCGFKVLPAWF